MQLKPLERSTRNRASLDAALGIYRNTILPEAQNPERQILYWIDHSADDLTDEFRCFAIKNERAVIGYLQYSYFREEHIIFFEYLCLQKTADTGLAPSEALKCIEDYLSQNYLPNFTIVFEVAHNRDSHSLKWIPDKKLIRYFTRLGFRSLSFDYQYPVLQSYDGGVSYPARLMIRLPNKRTDVTASEMRTLLRSIYFKHYLRWDRPFLEPALFAKRESLINQLYASQVAAISSDDTFGTTGDDKRSQLDRFTNREPGAGTILKRLFGPKMPRLTVAVGLVAAIQWMLHSVWLTIPFVLMSCMVYCLAEDTDDSRKLFKAVLAKVRIVSPR